MELEEIELFTTPYFQQLIPCFKEFGGMPHRHDMTIGQNFHKPIRHHDLNMRMERQCPAKEEVNKSRNQGRNGFREVPKTFHEYVGDNSGQVADTPCKRRKKPVFLTSGRFRPVCKRPACTNGWHDSPYRGVMTIIQIEKHYHDPVLGE